MELFAQQTVNGITIGMGYALVAVGLTLIFGILNIINFCHGEFYMLGGYGVYLATQHLGLSYLSGCVVAIMAVTAIGWLVEKVTIRPVISKDPLSALLTTFAASLFFINLAQGLFTATARPVDSPFNGVEQAVPLFLTYQKLGIVLVGAVTLLLVHLFLQRTVWGKMLRATSQNPFAAEVVGIDIKKIYSLSLSLGAGLSALAGTLIVPITGIYPMAGQGVMLKAFIVVILGGLGNVFGSILGGLILGLTEAVSTNFLNAYWAHMVGYGLLIVTLLLRPAGLFGQVRRVKH